jgi:uncharacterized protein YjiS (DUF1127 family)
MTMTLANAAAGPGGSVVAAALGRAVRAWQAALARRRTRRDYRRLLADEALRCDLGVTREQVRAALRRC